MRRVFSYLLDMALLGTPWPAILGMVGLDALGGAMYTSACSTLLFVMDSVLFLMRGRTLGMAVIGLGSAKGRRWLALVLTPLMLIVIFVVTFLIISAIQEARDMGEDVQTVAPLAGLVTLALNLAFLFGPRRRTLTDLVSGLHVVRDPALAALRGGLRPGLNIIDWLVAACIGVPVLLMLGHPSNPGAAIVSFAGLVAFIALELVLWKKTGATLGARALARPQ